MVVDPDGAELEILADSHGSSDVLGPDRSSQPIRHVVGKTHGIRFIAHGTYGDDGSEDLGLNNLRILRDVGNYGGFEVIPSSVRPDRRAAAGEHRSALRPRPLHESA